MRAGALARARPARAHAKRPPRALAGLVVGCALLVPASSLGQTVQLDDPRAEYLRLLQISGRAVPGSFTVRPSAGLVPGGADLGDHPWSERIEPAPPGQAGRARLDGLGARLRLFVNSRHPTGQNDGAVWQGKGLTSALDLETSVRWRALTVTVAPTVLYAQNAAFELAPVGAGREPEFAYPWRVIDLPQRFGPEGFWRLDPGQSEIALAWRGARLGFGTRNLWWGPGRRNAIVMSNNAAGFPHGFLGTNGPVDIRIGSLEAHWIWGRLGQSDWFDPEVAATDRFLTGLALAYSPGFLAGLSVGATRVFYGHVPDGGVPLGDYFLVLQGVRKKGLASGDNPLGDDDKDQLFSLFFRWALAESGFEVYGEWSRNDHAWDLTDLVLEPGHSEGFTLGLQKSVELGGSRLLAISTELTRLERSRTREVRASPVYYTHHIVRQGYTHEGQVIGAGIGPGGNAQHAAIDLYAPWGRAGVFIQRDVHDNDAFYDWAEANDRDFCCHDVSLRLGARSLVFAGPLEVGGGPTLTRELNRYFGGNEVWNLHLALTARWRGR